MGKNKIIIGLIVAILLIGSFAYLRNKRPVQIGPRSEKSITDIVNSNTNVNTDTNPQNMDTTIASKQYSFPGVLPLERINNKQAVISTKYGDVVIRLLNEEAPATVSNFVYLAELGFYDGLSFHRVVPDFVVQGGDPSSNGTGGPGYEFPDEPVQRDYARGVVAMANAGPNTNGSQFFIVIKDQPTLPKNYTIFGEVTSGLNTVDKISIGDSMLKVLIK